MQKTLIPYLRPAFQRTISILALTADFVDNYKFLTNWETVNYHGWTLPVRLDQHWWCGMWRIDGCLNVDEHERLGKGRRVFVKQYQKSCYRALCKVCYLKWIARQANNATRRIEQYSKNHNNAKPIHLILSIPPTQHHLPVKVLRQRMSQILKIAEFEGGTAIFHPFRFHESPVREWYVYPHFHIVGFGSKQKITQAFGKYGWFVKNEEERKSVFQTFCYLLSHCGVNSEYKSVTWFGDLSYSNLHVEKEPKITSCTSCGAKFVQICHDGPHPVVPPDKYYEGLADDDGKWHVVLTGERFETWNYSYDYAPTRKLDEILKSFTV